MVFPFEGELAGGSAEVSDGVLEGFDHGHGLGHGHFDAAEVLGLVILCSPLAGLLVDDEGPVGGVADIDVEGVVTLGDGEASDGDIAIGMKGGGAVGTGAPDGIGGVFADLAVFGEELSLAAFDSGSAVDDADGFAGDGGGSGFSGALGRRLGRGGLGKNGGGYEKQAATGKKRFHGGSSPLGGVPCSVWTAPTG